MVIYLCNIFEVTVLLNKIQATVQLLGKSNSITTAFAQEKTLRKSPFTLRHPAPQLFPKRKEPLAFSQIARPDPDTGEAKPLPRAQPVAAAPGAALLSPAGPRHLRARGLLERHRGRAPGRHLPAHVHDALAVHAGQPDEVLEHGQRLARRHLLHRRQAGDPHRRGRHLRRRRRRLRLRARAARRCELLGVFFLLLFWFFNVGWGSWQIVYDTLRIRDEKRF